MEKGEVLKISVDVVVTRMDMKDFCNDDVKGRSRTSLVSRSEFCKIDYKARINDVWLNGEYLLSKEDEYCDLSISEIEDIIASKLGEDHLQKSG